jgi:hypothetical protein
MSNSGKFIIVNDKENKYADTQAKHVQNLLVWDISRI